MWLKKVVIKHIKKLAIPHRNGVPLCHKPKTIFFTLEIVPIGNL